MDNKLGELSKPVGFVSDRASTQLKEGDPASIRPFFDVQGSSPLYSQEYVSALLAELEFEKQNNSGVAGMVEDYETKLEAKTLEGRCIEQERELFRVERTAHQQHAQELEKRIAELEQAILHIHGAALDITVPRTAIAKAAELAVEHATMQEQSNG